MARRRVPAKKAPHKASPSPARTVKPAASGGRQAARRGRETVNARRDRALEVFSRLRKEYPEATTALNWRNPYELLVATILSAQSTDQRVNMVTPALFSRYPSPADLAGAKREELEQLIHSTGFFRNKAKSLMGMATAVVEHFAGRIPDTLEELVTLPGVGRKTANVVLGTAFGRNDGVVVDTHVARLSHRLGFTKNSDPSKIELDIMKLFPQPFWTELSHDLILHGRAICQARRPRCEHCAVSDLCPSSRV